MSKIQIQLFKVQVVSTYLHPTHRAWAFSFQNCDNVFRGRYQFSKPPFPPPWESSRTTFLEYTHQSHWYRCEILSKLRNPYFRTFEDLSHVIKFSVREIQMQKWYFKLLDFWTPLYQRENFNCCVNNYSYYFQNFLTHKILVQNSSGQTGPQALHWPSMKNKSSQYSTELHSWPWSISVHVCICELFLLKICWRVQERGTSGWFGHHIPTIVLMFRQLCHYKHVTRLCFTWFEICENS